MAGTKAPLGLLHALANWLNKLSTVASDWLAGRSCHDYIRGWLSDLIEADLGRSVWTDLIYVNKTKRMA